MLIFLLFSCSDEKVINDSGSDKDILAASYDNSSHLMKIKFPSGNITSSDIFFDKNGKPLTNSKISNIRLFLKYIFVFIPEENKISILDKNTFTIVSEIDFTENGLQPIDITFANATEGYVIFKDAPKVALIDIYYFKIAKIIDMEGNPSSISSVGNQIYITIPLNDIVSVIDSREHSVVQNIQVGNVPYLIYPTIDGSKFVIISAGVGKIPGDVRDAVTSPSVTLIDIQSRNIVSTNSIETPKLDMKTQLPLSFIITNNDWAFIITKDNLIKLDIREPSYSTRVEQYSYSQIYHNNVYNELYVLDSQNNSSKLYQLDPVTGKKKENITLNYYLLKMTLY